MLRRKYVECKKNWPSFHWDQTPTSFNEIDLVAVLKKITRTGGRGSKRCSRMRRLGDSHKGRTGRGCRRWRSAGRPDARRTTSASPRRRARVWCATGRCRPARPRALPSRRVRTPPGGCCPGSTTGRPLRWSGPRVCAGAKASTPPGRPPCPTTTILNDLRFRILGVLVSSAAALECPFGAIWHARAALQSATLCANGSPITRKPMLANTIVLVQLLGRHYAEHEQQALETCF